MATEPRRSGSAKNAGLRGSKPGDPVRLVERLRTYTPPAVETWLKPGGI